jgi:hypothetical protein
MTRHPLACRSCPFLGDMDRHLSLAGIRDWERLDAALRANKILHGGEASRYAALHERRYWPPVVTVELGERA